MADSWWKKLLNNEESFDDVTDSKRVRIADSNRNGHVRMLNQYPKTPPIKETQSKKLEPINYVNERKTSDTKDDEIEKTNKFVPTDIPSPVFGFQHKQKIKKTDDITIPAYQRRSDDEKVSSPSLMIKEGKSTSEIVNDGLSKETHSEEAISEVNSSILPKRDKTPSEEMNQDEAALYTNQETDRAITEKTASSQTHKNNEVKVEVGSADVQRERSIRQEKRTTRIPYNVLVRPPKRYINEIKRNAKDHQEGSSHQQVRKPSLDLLSLPIIEEQSDENWCYQKENILKETLANFNVKGDIVDIIQGPTVTRFELRLKPGVKVNKVVSLTEDIKLSLAARQVRIAPVPGKNTVGIEIPNEKRKPVYLKQLLQSDDYHNSSSPLTAALGRDVSGKTIVTDLAKMPHGLIAGATGSGKSVCIHSLILSLIYKSTPTDLRLILIDPKVVELAAYQKLPHLAAPVLTQPKEAALALKWAVEEMERRYQLFAKNGVRDISRYNRDVQLERINNEKMPYIVIIIDELADLMMVSPQDVEEAICRIAQKARAAGIHLILATQRPSVDVITGLIKSNIPTRIAFSVSSQADSRTILDSGGADRLLGQGDMLFSENGARSLKRLQGCFVSDEEIDKVTEEVSTYDAPNYLFDEEQLTKQAIVTDDEEDDLFEEAAYFVIGQGQASISSLQRRFRIGYNRAARLIDQMEHYDLISEANGSKPRQVLMSKDTFQEQILGRD